MKKRLLSTFLGLGLFFSPQQAKGEKTKTQETMQQTVQTAKLIQQGAYRLVRYTQDEIDAKLNKLYANIVPDERTMRYGYDSETERVKIAKETLKKMAQYNIGKDVIMRMPEDVKIIVSEDFYIKRGIGGSACYTSNEKTKEKKILLSANYDNDMLGSCIVLAHEMRHAIQDAEGRYAIASPFPSERFVQMKLCEMETVLQNIVFESELKKGTNEKKSARCLFYEAELKRYRDAGMSQDEAEKNARTSLVMAYWSGLTQLPNGCSEISEALRFEINSWNNTYDKQTLINNADNISQKKLKYSDAEILKAQAKEVEEIQAEQTGKYSKYKRNTDIIPKYMEEMNLNLDKNWFTRTQRERATTGDYFVINEYPNGSIKEELVVMPNKNFFERYLSPEGVILEEFLLDNQGKAISKKIRYPNGKLSEEKTSDFHVKYDKDGFLQWEEHKDSNGYVIGKSYYKGGKQVKEEWVCDENDLFHGAIRSYSEDNFLECETIYNHGVQESETVYQKDGTFKTKIFKKHSDLKSILKDSQQPEQKKSSKNRFFRRNIFRKERH